MTNQEIILESEESLKRVKETLKLMKERGWFLLARLQGEESKYAKSIAHYKGLERSYSIIIKRLSK